MAEFLEDVAAFRGRMTTGSLIEFALTVRDKYLVDGSVGNVDPNRVRPPGIIRYTPSRGSHVIGSTQDPNTFRDKLPKTPSMVSSAKAAQDNYNFAGGSPPANEMRPPSVASRVDSVTIEGAKNAIKVTKK